MNGKIQTTRLDYEYIINCRLVNSESKPIMGLSIQAFDQDPKSVHDQLGGFVTTNAKGIAEIRFKKSDFTEDPGEGEPDIYFKVYRGNTRLKHQIINENDDNDVLRKFKPRREPITIQVNKHQVIEGRIVMEYGLPSKKMKVKLYSSGFADAERLLGETETDEDGIYSLAYDPEDKKVNIEVRALDKYDNEISLSKIKFNADPHEVINLVAPAEVQPLNSEYNRLTTALLNHIDHLDQLAEALENEERQDISLLCNETGWDGRIIALAATANRLSKETGLPCDVMYGLVRTGMPMEKKQLALISVDSVGQALEKAKKGGIIDISDEKITATMLDFSSFASETQRNMKVPGSNSNFNDLLKISGLKKGNKSKFSEIFLNHEGDSSELWQKTLDAKIPENDIRRLQLHGKLSYLTHNNVELVQKLHENIKDDLIEGSQEIDTNEQICLLVDQGLYNAENWIKLINDLAEGKEKELKKLIPPAYVIEDNIQDSLNYYADENARKFRIAFPTRVMSCMVKNDEIKIPEFMEGKSLPADENKSLKIAVSTFLKNADKKQFKLGQTPITKFVKDHDDLFKGIEWAEKKATIDSVNLLTSLWQITPSNDAMQVMIDNGLYSAQDVVALPHNAFIDRYGPLFRSPGIADLIYRKSEQVSLVAYNFYSMINLLDGIPPISSIAGSQQQQQEAKAQLKEGLKDYPTMESLFGSLDFCECEHCRSVLSPAAYLVDLMQFLDPDDLEWQNTIQKWKKNHDDVSYPFKPYPFKDKDEYIKFLKQWEIEYYAPYPFKTKKEWDEFKEIWRAKHPGKDDPEPECALKPYNLLVERRPDLPHLALTCENTNTALPYIDIVNEILEYYVANDKLTEKCTYDTGNATTPELLAEPQNILPDAYEVLREARYPLNLPYDLWIDTVRQFCEYFNTPLWQLLEVFRLTDEIFDLENDRHYDRSTILTEFLGLSPTEYSIFTDSDPLSSFHELYGYEGYDIVQNVFVDKNNRHDLKSAKALSRRLGISYKELVDLVRTNFINPNINTLITLYKLGVDAGDVFFYKNNEYLLKKQNLSEDEKKSLEDVKDFQNHLNEFNKNFPGFDAKRWLENAWQNHEFDKVIVLVDPDTGCNFDETKLQFADGTEVDNLFFLKINLFVRLWQKIGWKMEEIDHALHIFIPQNAPYDKGNVSKSPFKTVLTYLSHLKAINERLKLGKQSVLKILTLWDNLSTKGNNSLYAQLFLTKSVLKNDPVFDSPLGDYLSKDAIQRVAENTSFIAEKRKVKPIDKLEPSQFSSEPNINVSYDEKRQLQRLTYYSVLTDAKKEQLKSANGSSVLLELLDNIQKQNNEFFLIKSHLPALQGALSLTSDEIGLICTDNDQNIKTTHLSLETVSMLYRYALLAKALKLSIFEFIELKKLSGLNPFNQIIPGPVETIKDDYLFNQTLRFIEIAAQLKENGIKIQDLNYILRHR